jgi:hypothetical protein
MSSTPERRKPWSDTDSPQEQSRLSKRDRRILKWIAAGGFEDLVPLCAKVLQRKKENARR